MSSRSPRAQDGFALTELVAACALLMIGVLGVLASFDRSRDVISRSEVRETAIFRAERELERLRTLPFNQLGLSSLPTPSANPASPDRFVRAGNTYQWNPADASTAAPMVSGGVVAPKLAFDDGRMRGTLHIYITTYADPVGGVPQARRVIVAAEVAGPWSPRAPVTVATIVHDPGPAP